MNQAFFDYLKTLKGKSGLRIVDAHVHPFDVMGVIHCSECATDADTEISEAECLRPGLMERLKFGYLANFLSNNLFSLFVKTYNQEIRKIFKNTGEKRAASEMSLSLVDNLALLPVEPWAETDKVRKLFKDDKFLLLGSIDINKITLEEIEALVDRYVQELNIVGFKLHPNLQNFKPQPSDNPPEIEQKLKLIYQLAEKHGLYLHFHGGLSSFTKVVNSKFGSRTRSKTNGLLENFCRPDGSSEVFNYKVPTIIAHLGHFGLNKVNKPLVKTIIGKYDNVFFDTAATSPRMIREFIELIGSERIVFGSDALYNKIIYSIYFVHQAAKRVNNQENLDKIMCNILGDNYYSKILYGKNFKIN